MHDPMWSRPLSENEKRLIWNERAMPKNSRVIKVDYSLPERDAVFCHKQGMVFMEAADQGMDMSVFAPMYMQSQLAGLIDHECRKMETATDIYHLNTLMETPEIIVGLLFWFDEFGNQLEAGDRGAVLLFQEAVFLNSGIDCADISGMKKIPGDQEIALMSIGKPVELNTAEQKQRHIDNLEYAYWLGYVYRYECIIHEEDSRMVYFAFEEEIMRGRYKEWNGSVNDMEKEAGEICQMLDRYLLEVLWKNMYQGRKMREHAKAPEGKA